MITTREINKAVSILQSGGLVAFPTETVYGLGADAANGEAVKKIFAAKGRPAHHPLIVHLSCIEQIVAWASEVPPSVYRLADAFWPGPLTILLHKHASVRDEVTGGQSTVGVRLPNHPVARALLQAFGKGIAAPSANKFTCISPTSSGAVLAELGEQVDLILEGGACAVGLESTILDLSREVPAILRPGMIRADEIAEVLGSPIKGAMPTSSRVPGMHPVHYAPHTPTQLMSYESILAYHAMAPTAALMMNKGPNLAEMDIIPMPKGAREYAQVLYRTLRMVDNKRYTHILIERVPETTDWVAIRDRLSRACRS